MLQFTKREKILLFALASVSLMAAVFAYRAFFVKVPDVAFKLEGGKAIPVFESENNSGEVPDEDKIVIHIAGAVKNPGVYELEEGSRVIDAVKAAGGYIPEADIAGINLAKKLQDEDKIYIPQVGESPASGDAVNGGISPSDGKININSAGLDELDKLPGIGPALAQRIIDYRNQHGPFKSIEELKNVSGIGEKRFEEIKNLVKVN
ncbi:ComE operon protein 1 [Fervidicola ferrireducens]|jgi:competence protein ComEA|uniref:ComE operon protein 1 n=1 Tax=Fervidicola ferrireducens TaxID=520764 RepID=A0A140L246_9FIRM|nr:helix-hairpin-helix domain-containing protein [Fervidicola ferrireducens]KXG74621.1 ComE operon protein 1 [Fervidicola ferrireducens]